MKVLLSETFVIKDRGKIGGGLRILKYGSWKFVSFQKTANGLLKAPKTIRTWIFVLKLFFKEFRNFGQKWQKFFFEEPYFFYFRKFSRFFGFNRKIIRNSEKEGSISPLGPIQRELLHDKREKRGENRGFLP